MQEHLMATCLIDSPVLGAAELLQEALSTDNAAANGLTSSGLAALFAEAWFPSLTPGYGAAGQPFGIISSRLCLHRSCMC